MAMERLLQVVRPLLRARGCTTLEEFDAVLDRIGEEEYRALKEAWASSSPSAQAQLLAYEAAVEAETAEDAAALARRALAIDPQCIDALLILAEEKSDSVEDFAASLEEVVAIAAGTLGDGFFSSHPDDLWFALEARPYLRARYQLADVLRISGRTPEAAAQFEALLDLEPEDHLRARDPLIACYLALADYGGVRRVFHRFEQDSGAVFPWASVLERHAADDLAGARAALRAARRRNRHAERYLTFKDLPPEGKPDMYEPGSRDEAAHCLYILGLAWAAHPSAIHWVRAH